VAHAHNKHTHLAARVGSILEFEKSSRKICRKVRTLDVLQNPIYQIRLNSRAALTNTAFAICKQCRPLSQNTHCTHTHTVHTRIRIYTHKFGHTTEPINTSFVPVHIQPGYTCHDKIYSTTSPYIHRVRLVPVLLRTTTYTGAIGNVSTKTLVLYWSSITHDFNVSKAAQHYTNIMYMYSKKDKNN
jgi:hypothetical protein